MKLKEKRVSSFLFLHWALAGGQEKTNGKQYGTTHTQDTYTPPSASFPELYLEGCNQLQAMSVIYN